MKRSTMGITIALVVGILLLASVGRAVIQSQEQAVRQQIESELAGVAQLKADQIAGWRDERLDEGAELMERPLLRMLAHDRLVNPNETGEDTLLAELRAIQRHGTYQDVLIVDRAGTITLSAAGTTGHIDGEGVLTEALASLQPAMTDLHIGTFSPVPHISVIAPIVDDGGTAQGAFVLVTDARQFLYPYIQSWPVPSTTAETLLVRRDGDSVRFLNDLRHREGTALTLRIPLAQADLPAAMAVQGREETMRGYDYRGVEVIAALQPVPDSPWFLVAKMDAAEALAGWQERLLLLLAVFGGAAALLGTLTLVAWQSQRRRHLERLYEAEQARHAGDMRYAITLRSIGEGVIATDAQGHVILLNPVAEVLTGWQDADARGRPLAEVFDIVDETSGAAVEDPVSIVLREHKIVELGNHTVLIDRGGKRRPIADAASPIQTESGDLLGVVLVFRDQSAERAARQALEASEGRLRAMVAAVPDLIFRIDRDHRFIDCHASDLRLLMLPPAAFLGRRLDEVMPAAVAEGGARAIDLALASGAMQSFEYALELPGGSAWFEQRIAPMSPTEVIAITRDISEMRRNEAVANTRLRLLEFASDNPLPALLTRTLDEVGALVASPVGFYHFVEADQRTLSLQAWSTRTLHEFCTAQGHCLHDSVESAGVWADAVRRRAPVIHNDYASLPSRRRMPEGHTLLVRELVVPILRQERVVGILGVGNKPTDYTAADVAVVSYLADVAWEIVERKRIEEQQASLQAQLVQAQKLETIGQLAGGIAHDFNNMLAVILMRCEMALQEVDPLAPVHRHLVEIHSTGQRSAELTRKLLGFARKQMISPRLLDLNETVGGMLRMLQRLIGEEIDLQWQPGQEPLLVLMDPSQIDQILVNLCVNARDAIDGAGRITIQTEKSVLDQADAALHPPLVAGSYVALVVSDDGIGMDAAVLAHIFEPFFTTKEVGKGTGLGLATVYGIVQQNRGHILVDSVPGRGTTFRIYLPCAPEMEQTLATEAA